MEINIKVNKNQAGVIKSALDLYSRLLMGQFEQLDSTFLGHSRYWEDYDKRERLDELLKEMRNIIYPELKGYAHWGISNKNCPMDSKVGYDIIQVLRFALYNASEGERYMSVDSSPPLKFGNEELCKVEIKK